MCKPIFKNQDRIRSIAAVGHLELVIMMEHTQQSLMAETSNVDNKPVMVLHYPPAPIHFDEGCSRVVVAQVGTGIPRRTTD